jgi:hypothetical protein
VRRRSLACSAAVIALCSIVPVPSAAQGRPPAAAPPSRPPRLGRLGASSPNPVVGSATIPFEIICAAGSPRTHVVSLRIYNVLAQLVAIPALEGAGRPVARLHLACGRYAARWDGNVLRTRRRAPGGTYVLELDVDGRRTTRKLLVAR